MAAQLSRLREFLPAGTPILAGGRAAPAYRRELLAAGAVLCDSDRAFSEELIRARSRREPDPAGGVD